jgi:hypothetical protein
MVGRFRETPGIAIDNVGRSFWVNCRKETAESKVGEESRGSSEAAILVERCRMSRDDGDISNFVVQAKSNCKIIAGRGIESSQSELIDSRPWVRKRLVSGWIS